MAAITTHAREAGPDRNAGNDSGPVQLKPRRGRKPTRFTPTILASYGVIGLYSLTLVLPLYWLLISAFKPRLETVTEPFIPTFSDGFTHFVKVWNLLKLGNALFNSFYITFASLALTLVIAIPAAYALARSKGRVSVIFERIYAMGFLIPGFAALLPTLLLAIQIGLFNTREFMILYLPASAQPLAVILLTQFMRTVPSELEETAMIDGASRFRILRSVYLPLTMPGIATISILNFISFWNEYLYALILTGANPRVRTVQVALPTLQGNQGITDYALVCAGTVISVLPVFIAYIVLNRRMEDALVQGAIKG